MNTNPRATTILCYGDSNTWGQKPDKSGRYPANERWTGRLQAALGPTYYVIEEGLSSRTTDLDYDKKPGRNGKTYLVPCLASHNPLDVVVLMLGTNDLKIEFNRSAHAIAQAIAGLVKDIQQNALTRQGTVPKIVLVSPILVDAKAREFTKLYADIYYNAESAEKSKLLAGEIKEAANASGCAFVDASQYGGPGVDGIHFSPEAHIGLAEALKNTILSLEH
ncbi:MAG TPA: SGNH/GDSL hydrolase family protein [Candidatus Saccharimonadales bacterium]|nr:SGNH/GDSL hydrolase family protein [Candidatus Saccharimonadales bacterium]